MSETTPTAPSTEAAASAPPEHPLVTIARRFVYGQDEITSARYSGLREVEVTTAPRTRVTATDGKRLFSVAASRHASPIPLRQHSPERFPPWRSLVASFFVGAVSSVSITLDQLRAILDGAVSWDSERRPCPRCRGTCSIEQKCEACGENQRTCPDCEGFGEAPEAAGRLVIARPNRVFVRLPLPSENTMLPVEIHGVSPSSLRAAAIGSVDPVLLREGIDALRDAGVKTVRLRMSRHVGLSSRPNSFGLHDVLILDDGDEHGPETEEGGDGLPSALYVLMAVEPERAIYVAPGTIAGAADAEAASAAPEEDRGPIRTDVPTIVCARQDDDGEDDTPCYCSPCELRRFRDTLAAVLRRDAAAIRTAWSTLAATMPERDPAGMASSVARALASMSDALTLMEVPAVEPDDALAGGAGIGSSGGSSGQIHADAHDALDEAERELADLVSTEEENQRLNPEEAGARGTRGEPPADEPA